MWIQVGQADNDDRWKTSSRWWDPIVEIAREIIWCVETDHHFPFTKLLDRKPPAETSPSVDVGLNDHESHVQISWQSKSLLTIDLLILCMGSPSTTQQLPIPQSVTADINHWPLFPWRWASSSPLLSVKRETRKRYPLVQFLSEADQCRTTASCPVTSCIDVRFFFPNTVHTQLDR